MKTSNLVLAALLAAALPAMAAAQNDPRAQETPDAAADDSKVNPMTGRLLSEERLTRQLGSQKLTTSIIQEQVKQAELRNQLGLAGTRKAVEEARLRSESVNIGRRGTDVPVRDSLVTRERAVASKGATQATPTPQAPIALPPAPPPPVASGSILIGADTLNVTARYNGPDARITYVDAQPRPPQSQLQPTAAPVTPIAAGNFVPAVAGPAGGAPIQLVPNYNR